MNSSPADFSSWDDAIETAAAAWLVERDEGFAPGRAAQFAAWRAADPQHEIAVDRAEKTLRLLGEMPGVRVPLTAQLADEGKIVRLGFFRPPIWLTGLAAAVALAAGVWWLGSPRTDAMQHYASTPTRQQQIALVDGSVVNLNVSTDMRVALRANERHVTLTAGEAHFAVAHDTARPFIVTAGGVSVRAVGTAFSVSLCEHGVEVLVTEGKVEVTRDSAGTGPTTALPAEHPLLVAGERTLISRDVSLDAVKVERISANELQDAVRWHSYVMTFSDLPLRDAVVLFNRRNVQQLVLADAALGERKIGGMFAADQVEAFVRLLAQDDEIVVDRRDGNEIVLRRTP